MRPQPNPPPQLDSIASIRLIILFGVYVVLFYVSLANQLRVELVPRIFLGLDFFDFFSAALEYSKGGSPYDVSRFVTPPPSLLPALLLKEFWFEQAAAIWFAANIGFVACGVVIACRKNRASNRNMVFCLLFAFASYPVQMLIERGNIDGLVFIGLAIALFCSNRIATGLAFSTVLLAKIYPILLAPYLLFKRSNPLLFIVIFVAGYLAIFNHHFVDYLPALLKRGELLRFDENISPHGIFVLIAAQTKLHVSGLFYYLAVPYLVLSYLLDWYLLRSKSSDDYRLLIMSSCVIPMLFFPKLVYAYSAIVLILLFICIDRFDDHFSPIQKVGISLIQVAIMFPAVGFNKAGFSSWVHLIPQCGLLLLAALIIGWKITRVRRLFRTPNPPAFRTQ